MYRTLMVVLACFLCAGNIRAAESKKVALLVGVNKYTARKFPDLQFAEADVEAVGTELRKLGFETTVLKGSGEGEKQATRANIEAAVSSLLKPLDKDDLMLFMFSGHCEQIEVTGENQKRHEDAFFCPVNAVRDDPATLVNLSNWDERRPVGQKATILVLLDASRDRPKAAVRVDNPPAGNRAVIPDNVAFLFSCRAGQESYEFDNLGHGLFTHCLLEGLRGKAAKAGQITWSGLTAYVEDRLANDDMKARMPKGRTQEPYAAGAIGRLVLGTVEQSIRSSILEKP